jgi:hypothetical protein
MTEEKAVTENRVNASLFFDKRFTLLSVENKKNMQDYIDS